MQCKYAIFDIYAPLHISVGTCVIDENSELCTETKGGGKEENG